MKKLLLRMIASLVLAGLPCRAALLDEPFNYPDGPLTTVSGGVWALHSGTVPLQVDVTGGKADGFGFDIQIHSIGTEQAREWAAGTGDIQRGGNGEDYLARWIGADIEAAGGKGNFQRAGSGGAGVGAAEEADTIFRK